MPTALPMPTKAVGDVFTTTLWNSNLRDNINKLLNTGHRVLTVAQFAALGAPEGTKGTVAPDEVYLEVDSTNGIVWHLIYESTDASSSKWRCIGGPPLISAVETAETTASSTYVALATAGPSIALPRLGDFIVTLGALITANFTNGDNYMSYDIGGTGAVDADSLRHAIGSDAENMHCMRMRLKTGLTAVTLTSKFKTPTASNTATFANRWMSVLPTRIG